MSLSYRKTFNEVLQEEQSSRDFGPLLSRMGVVDENGQSAMDANQWEAASESIALGTVVESGADDQICIWLLRLSSGDLFARH